MMMVVVVVLILLLIVVVVVVVVRTMTPVMSDQSIECAFMGTR